jgi:transcriptional regulator NrdR family protein
MRCRQIFTTTESPYARNLYVVKRNNSKQRFIYEKLFASVFTVLYIKKVKDAGAAALLSKKVCESITASLIRATNENDKAVSTAEIIELVFKALLKTGKHFADSYIYYSDFRRTIGVKRKLIK